MLIVYVLWLRAVLMYFDWCFVQLCAVGMVEGCNSLGSVPGTEVIYVSSEGGDMVGDSVLRDSWKYNDVVVPVSIDR